ncbi:DUF448 domain-containing protein [Nakamurella aerolata]|uniref:YlxR family protein n=1 Tax=Nakamurella aerolata TaxID=1656892 RepID=A0A849A3I2_9ACTN|nr:YlxR family protein [Nakamurella aerolata]
MSARPAQPAEAADTASTARASSKGCRTCVGCRGKDRPVALLRVVAATGTDAPERSGAIALVPDPRRRLPGRGAWIHRHDECLRLAERRRAFNRALRLPAGQAVDSRQVKQYLVRKESAGDPL